MFAVNRNYTTYTYCTIIVIPPLHSTFWDLSPGCILLFLETSTLKNGLASAPSKEELCYSLSFCFSETAVTEPFSCSLKLKKAFSFSILLLWIVTYLLLSMRSVLGNIDPRFWKYGPSTASLSKLTEGQYFPVWLKFITWHLQETENTWLTVWQWKLFIWLTPDQGRTNQNSQIYLKTTSP